MRMLVVGPADGVPLFRRFPCLLLVVVFLFLRCRLAPPASLLSGGARPFLQWLVVVACIWVAEVADTVFSGGGVLAEEAAGGWVCQVPPSRALAGGAAFCVARRSWVVGGLGRVLRVWVGV